MSAVKLTGEERAVLIAGPTASGKSSLGISLADEALERGRVPVILNADSMQVYRDLRVLTARPSKADEERAPHHLYGFVSACDAYNTGRWLEDMGGVLDDLREPHLPIIVGGTGLYFKALTEGFAAMPDVPADVRSTLRRRLETEGANALHAALEAIDPQTARTLSVHDSQRILRALEIYEVSGRSIRSFQTQAQSPPLIESAACLKLVILPERNLLYSRIEKRFDQMVADGGLDEVARLKDLNLDPNLPIMKAIGVPQFIQHLSGLLSSDEAIQNAKQESRRYAKRQMTWMRNQMDETWERLALK